MQYAMESCNLQGSSYVLAMEKKLQKLQKKLNKRLDIADVVYIIVYKLSLHKVYC